MTDALTRVQIPAYSDHWMRGDRYGEVTGTVKRWVYKPIGTVAVQMYRIKLDKSGKTVRFPVDDCEVI
jgi:hypothetical protein